jgi:hypothetical protein
MPYFRVIQSEQVLELQTRCCEYDGVFELLYTWAVLEPTPYVEVPSEKVTFTCTVVAQV